MRPPSVPGVPARATPRCRVCLHDALVPCLPPSALGRSEHVDFALGETMRGYLGQRELYARLSLKALPSQQQADLFAWAESHVVLSFLIRGGLLERFAALTPSSWAVLTSLAHTAKQCGCAEESRYALLTCPEALRALVADAAPTAGKLLRLLPWCANPTAAPTKCGGTRLRTAETFLGDDDDRLRVVRIRHAGRTWEHTLDWDAISTVREPGEPGVRAIGLTM